MFKMAFSLTLLGLLMIFFMVFIWVLLPAWGIIWLLVLIVGVILNVFGLYTVYSRARGTTLYHLLEEPKRGWVNWLYVWGDREIEVLPAMKKVGRTSYSKDIQQQINDLKTYRFADHEVRVVPEGAQYSTNFKYCLYCEQAKKDWKVKSLRDIRKLFLKQKEKDSNEEIKKLEELREEIA